MIRRAISTMVALSLIIGFAIASESESGEHSSEHPSEHPSTSTSKKTDASISKEQLAQVIEKYVSADAKLRGGYFVVYDKQAKKPLALTLKKVHKERLSRTASQVYFACADFVTSTGKVYDLDIFLKGSSANKLSVTEISVHKEAGKARYTWQKKGDLWAKIPVGAKAAAKPKSEHPSEHPN